MPERHDPWPDHVVEGAAQVLGETNNGLTGSEIGRLLAQCGIDDPSPGSAKWRRLCDALLQRQRLDGAANQVIAFFYAAMEPVRYRDNAALFTARLDALNEVFVYIGLRLNNKGKLQIGAKAETLPEAAQHANSLRAELTRRHVHPLVLKYCSREILEGNPFHAALEAAKSVPDRIREMTGLTGDGAALIDAAMGLSHPTPRIAINTLRTTSEQDEHKGFANLCKGLLGMFRNPVAHDPRITRSVTDAELLELLMIVSMVHRRLDAAVVLP
jgi:uncharacterized protein (TIGR02391 family)